MDKNIKFKYTLISSFGFLFCIFLDAIALMLYLLEYSEAGNIEGAVKSVYNESILVVIVSFILFPYIIYCLFRTYIIGYKIEIYDKKVVLYKSRNKVIEIDIKDVIEIDGSNGKLDILYKYGTEQRVLRLHTIFTKKLIKIMAIFDNNLKKINPDYYNEIEVQDEIQEIDYLEKDFVIRAPKRALILFLIFLIVPIVILLIIFIISFLNEETSRPDIYAFVLMAFPSGLGAIGVFVWFREKLIYKDSVITYVKIFSKRQSAKVEDIKYLYLDNRGALMKVYCLDQNGNPLINFLDDGTAFKSGEFINILIKHGTKQINDFEYYNLKNKYKG